MQSSYNKIDITYGELIQTITKSINPKKIVEIGILDGYSLYSFVKSARFDTEILAYDIFDEFNGNHSFKDKICEKFNQFSNVKINYGDFYKLHHTLNEIDILHVDIANNGDVLEYVIKNYLELMTHNGIILFEGGSKERDNVEWMSKYNKPLISPVVEKYINQNMNIQVIGNFPSITIIKKSQ